MRHTFISGVIGGGATVKTAQELARHASPALTIGRYAHARLHDLTGALEALPDLQPERENHDEPRQALATGTHGGAQQLAQQSGRETLRIGASGRDGESSATENAVGPKSMEPDASGEVVRPDAKGRE